MEAIKRHGMERWIIARNKENTEYLVNGVPV